MPVELMKEERSVHNIMYVSVALNQYVVILRQAIPQNVMVYALFIICSKIIWDMLCYLSACDIVVSSIVTLFSSVQCNVMLMKVTSKINYCTLSMCVITFTEVLQHI